MQRETKKERKKRLQCWCFYRMCGNSHSEVDRWRWEHARRFLNEVWRRASLKFGHGIDFKAEWKTTIDDCRSQKFHLQRDSRKFRAAAMSRQGYCYTRRTPVGSSSCAEQSTNWISNLDSICCRCVMWLCFRCREFEPRKIRFAAVPMIIECEDDNARTSIQRDSAIYHINNVCARSLSRDNT